METNACAKQVLAKIAVLARIDLRAAVIEIVVLNERAPLGIPVVVRSGNNLPGEVGVAGPAAGAEVSSRTAKVHPRTFGLK